MQRSMNPAWIKEVKEQSSLRGTDQMWACDSSYRGRANWLHPLPAKRTVGTWASLRWSLLDMALAPRSTRRLQLPGSLGKDPWLTAGPGEASSSKLRGVSRERDEDRNILDRNSFFLGGEPVGQKGKKHIPKQLKRPRGSLADSELHRTLWNAKPVTAHPQVCLFSIALASPVYYSPKSLSCEHLGGGLWGWGRG